MEQIYFALRMAVGEMFCQDETMPIILDDAFVMYDDKRLKQTLKWLYHSKKTGDIVYLPWKRTEDSG